MSVWTHAICDACWVYREGDRMPVRLLRGEVNVCCLCKSPTNGGIFVRIDPADTPCGGVHDGWDVT